MKFEWLISGEDIHYCTGHNARHRRKGFIEKTLKGITSFFLNDIFSEEIVLRGGLLQSIDPRAKVLTFGLFIIAVSLFKNIFLICGVYLLTIILAYFSKIGLRFFMIRVWLFIPLFSGIIAIPALFNIFVPGEPVIELIKFDSEKVFGPFHIPRTIYITRQGIMSASTFVMRVAASVSLVVLLVLTTKWPHILKALTVYRIPRFFTFILGMTYRYIHLLLRQIEDVYLARKSRIIGYENSRSERKWVATQIKFVLKRSLKISEDVYTAMISRGLIHEIKVIDSFKFRPVDYVWIILSIVIISVTLRLNWL